MMRRPDVSGAMRTLLWFCLVWLGLLLARLCFALRCPPLQNRVIRPVRRDVGFMAVVDARGALLLVHVLVRA